MTRSYIRNNILLFFSLIIVSAAYAMISETSETLLYLSTASIFIIIFALILNLIYFVPGMKPSFKFAIPGLIHIGVVAIVYYKEPEFKFFMIGGLLHLVIGVWTIIEHNGLLKGK